MYCSETGFLHSRALRQNVNGDGYLNDGAAAYYGRRAKGGAASVATFEGIVDGELGKGGATQICMDTPNIDRGLSRIAYEIKGYGAVPTMELQHAGMFANRAVERCVASSKGIAYGPVECECDGRHILPMTEEIIERTIGNTRMRRPGSEMRVRNGSGPCGPRLDAASVSFSSDQHQKG